MSNRRLRSWVFSRSDILQLDWLHPPNFVSTSGRHCWRLPERFWKMSESLSVCGSRLFVSDDKKSLPAVVVLVDREVMTDTFMRQTYHNDEMLHQRSQFISEAAAVFWFSNPERRLTDSVPVHPLVDKANKNCKSNTFLSICLVMGNMHNWVRSSAWKTESHFVCLADALSCHFNTDSFYWPSLVGGFLRDLKSILRSILRNRLQFIPHTYNYKDLQSTLHFSHFKPSCAFLDFPFKKMT